MEIEFDDVKDAANLPKHVVSLVLGAAVLENSIGEVVSSLAKSERASNSPALAIPPRRRRWNAGCGM
jgi:uncharacterized DUF497 family protein